MLASHSDGPHLPGHHSQLPDTHVVGPGCPLDSSHGHQRGVTQGKTLSKKKNEIAANNPPLLFIQDSFPKLASHSDGLQLPGHHSQLTRHPPCGATQ